MKFRNIRPMEYAKAFEELLKLERRDLLEGPMHDPGPAEIVVEPHLDRIDEAVQEIIEDRNGVIIGHEKTIRELRQQVEELADDLHGRDEEIEALRRDLASTVHEQDMERFESQSDVEPGKGRDVG